jgi:hypothetical protein
MRLFEQKQWASWTLREQKQWASWTLREKKRRTVGAVKQWASWTVARDRAYATPRRRQRWSGYPEAGKCP